MGDSGGEVEEIFDRHWLLYRKVIDCNYMDHHEIAEAISNHWLQSNGGKSMGRVLDLGCGDTEVPGRIMERFGCGSITGVDSSERALEEAAKKPVWAGVEPDWIEADLREISRLGDVEFDTVFAGFTLHHLSLDEKNTFLQDVNRLLAPDGTFYFFDVFLLDSLDRETSIERYLEWILEDWQEITAEEFERIDTHIRSSDFPEPVSWVDEAGKKAGFCISRIRPPIKNKFHKLFALTRRSL